MDSAEEKTAIPGNDGNGLKRIRTGNNMRKKLLIMMLPLVLLLVSVVVLASPYMPIVEPVMDIEKVWRIEDTRTESDVPLVKSLTWDGMPLVYEASQNTFYCPIGLGYQNDWPQLHLLAPEAAKGTRICFTDDYAYDSCSDAVKDGYAYQLLTYDSEHYAYTQIVFTGLMQVHVVVEEEIVYGEDVPAQIAVGFVGDGMTSNGRIHKRGGATAHEDKCGYKIEFTKKSNGKGKISRDVPRIGETENLVLLSMVLDETMMHDRLNWEIYNELVSEDEAYGDRSMAYVELFINGDYRGVYLLLMPYDHAEEIAKYGPRNVMTDSIYRSGSHEADKDRETYQGPFLEGRGFELHYTPADLDGAVNLQDYIDLCLTEDDEAFCARALEQIDVDSMLRYMLLAQGCGWADNIFNNMFLWARHENGKLVYSFAPWDTDMSWGSRTRRIGEGFDMWIYFPLADRMVSLDAGGIMRRRMGEIWDELRSGVLSQAFIEETTERLARELNESGAAYRNAERWQTDNYEAVSDRIIDFACIRLPLIDETVAAITESPEAKFPFLDNLERDYAVDKSEVIDLHGDLKKN